MVDGGGSHAAADSGDDGACVGAECCREVPAQCEPFMCAPGMARALCGGVATGITPPDECEPVAADCGILEVGQGPYCCPEEP